MSGLMVFGVTKCSEPLIVIPVVEGSSPFSHPILLLLPEVADKKL